jgi:enoyl-CoA hydratase
VSEQRIRYEDREGVARLHWDDGKANAVSSEALAELNGCVERAEKDEAKAIALIGRPGVFCAGFDLAELGRGGDATRNLVRGGAELLIRLYGLPLPVVTGCTGHALGMGALLLLASDVRLGAGGPHKIGLNEVAISLALPTFGTELATARLSRRHLTRAAQLAEIYGPDAAVDAGFLDRVCEQDALDSEAVAEATRLGELNRSAFKVTKRRLHEATIDRIRASLDDEFA